MKSVHNVFIFSLAFLILGLLFIPLASQGYTYPDEPCGMISGVSDFADETMNSGRVDFEHADWDAEATTIANEDRLCITPEGEISGEDAFAWNMNVGWIDFKWGEQNDPDYTSNRLIIDFALEGELASTGNAYWSGYAWSDTAGWIWFDWTTEDCLECNIQDRVHTLLPAGWPSEVTTEEVYFDVEGYAWSDILGWINFGSTAMDSTNVVQELALGEPSPTIDITHAVLIYHMDERGGTIEDASGLEHDGTYNGELYYEIGEMEAALGFDGSDDYISVADTSDINTATHDKRSVEIWFNVKDKDSLNKQVIYEEGGTTRGLNIYIQSGLLYVGGFNNDSAQSNWAGTFLSTTVPSSKKWHQVVLTLEGGTTVTDDAMNVYLDGVLFDSGQGSQLWSHTANIGVGKVDEDTLFHDGSFSGSGNPFNGELDQLIIYNRVLSEDEVAEHYQYGLDAENGSDGFVLYMQMEDEDTSIFDSSGRENHGTYNGGLYHQEGITDYALGFDGIDDVVDIIDTYDINLGEHPHRSVQLWFNVKDKNKATRQMIYEEGGGLRGVNVYIDAGTLYIGGYNNEETGWQGTYFSTSAIESNMWHAVTFTLDGSDTVEPDVFSAYVDGQLLGIGEGSQLYEHIGDIALGGVREDTQFHDGDYTGAGYYFEGSIDEVKLYDRAIEVEEIEEEYIEQLGEIFVVPSVDLFPDPYMINKYGLDGAEQAPLADGEDGYEIILKLWDLDRGVYLDDDYMVTMTATPSSDSHVYLDQVNQTGDAIQFSEVIYDPDRQAFVMTVRSWAPTSRVNGYDQDGDGQIDYYFDSEFNNQWILESVDFEVTGPATIVVDESRAPLWELDYTSEPLYFEFAPAIELTNLNHREEDSTLGTSIPSTSYQVIDFEGIMVSRATDWGGTTESPQITGFDVTSSISIISEGGDYVAVFDTNDDGTFDSTLDQTSVTLQDLWIDDGDPNALNDYAARTENYVPFEEDLDAPFDFLSGISTQAMIVADGTSCEEDSCSDLDPTQNDDLVFDADLIVKEIRVTDGNILNVMIANIGYVAVPEEQRPVTILMYSDGEYFWGYNSSTLSDQSFFDAGGETTLAPRDLSGNHTVEVCIDVHESAIESDETNNCLTTVVGDYPDLEVSDILVDEDGKLTVEVSNISETAVPTEVREDGHLYIYIDPPSDVDTTSVIDADWTYSWSTLTYTEFFEPGGISQIQPQILAGEHRVIACIDPKDVVEEYNEDDFNCLEKDLSFTPDFIVDDIYLDPETFVLVVDVANEGTGDFPGLGETEDMGQLFIYIDDMDDPVWTYNWSTLSDSRKNFYEVGGSSGITPQVLTGDHIVRACINPNELVNELDYGNNCSDAALTGTDMSLSYTTEISYAIPDVGTVRYSSNYLPQSALESTQYQVPVEDEYKLDATISGSVTGTVRDNLYSDSEFVVIGDVSASATRNELYKRFSQLTKGVHPWQAYDHEITGDLDPGSYVESLLDGQLLYAVGDVQLHNLSETYDQKTIVVEGNVYIDDDLNGEATVGIIAFQDSTGYGGNVYLHSDVTDLNRVILYADQSLLSYDGDPSHLTKDGYDGQFNQLMDLSLDTRRSTLPNQLYFGGSLISKNTVGGEDNSLLPDGSTSDDSRLVREYDLFHLREFVLCWVSTDSGGIPVDQDGDGRYVEDDGTPDLDDVVSCDDRARSTRLQYEGNVKSAENAPLFFEYIPPPNDLPILGGGDSSGASFY